MTKHAQHYKVRILHPEPDSVMSLLQLPPVKTVKFWLAVARFKLIWPS